METLVWLLSTVLLTALIAVLIWAFLTSAGRKGKSAETFGDDPAAQARVDRIEELPVAVQAVRGDLLQQAKAHFANDNLRDAIICLFSYQLIQLDNHHAIHLERGKTNRQYLKELRPRAQLRGLLEGTMLAFEDVFFGNHTLTRERFESCLNRMDAFHQEIQADPSLSKGAR